MLAVLVLSLACTEAPPVIGSAPPADGPAAAPTVRATPADGLDADGLDADGLDADGPAAAGSPTSGGDRDPGAHIPPDAVRIEPGQDWQAVVDATPPGTTFVIAPGLHRGASVELRSYDRVVGEPGAVMDGSTIVDDWVPEGDRWIAEGFAPDSEILGELLEDWRHQGYRQELFLDGERLLHARTVEEVGPGSWWFDMRRDRLILGEDPTGHRVEISDVERAITGPGSVGVTIEGLEVRQYGSLSQEAAIDAVFTTDWTIRDVHVHHNHAAGIRMDLGTHVIDSRVADNGQIGINGAQDDVEHSRPMMVVGSDVVGNGILHYLWFWESGGIKLTYARGAVVQRNHVADNRGPGIWFDLDCFDAVITDNEVHRNSSVGIFYEISDRATIARNTITGNGHGILPEQASGIWISNSGNVTVVDNTMSGNRNEIIMVAAPREEFGFPVSGNLIANNDITLTDGFLGLSVVTDQVELYDPDVNVFRSNSYTLDGCEPCFFWDERIDTDTWLDLGNDVDSTFDGERRR